MLYKTVIISAILMLVGISLANASSQDDICFKQSLKVDRYKEKLLNTRIVSTIDTFTKRLDNSLFQQKTPSERELLAAKKLLTKTKYLQKTITDQHIKTCLSISKNTNYKSTWYVKKGLTEYPNYQAYLEDTTNIIDIANRHISTIESFIALASQEMQDSTDKRINSPTFTQDEIEKNQQFFPNFITFVNTFDALEQTIYSIKPPLHNSRLKNDKTERILKFEGNKIVSNLNLFNTFYAWVSQQDTQDKIIGTCEIQEKHKEFCERVISASKIYLSWASAMTGAAIENIEESGNIDQIVKKRGTLIKTAQQKHKKLTIKIENNKPAPTKKVATKKQNEAPIYLRPNPASQLNNVKTNTPFSPSPEKYGYTSDKVLPKITTPTTPKPKKTSSTGVNFSALILLSILGAFIYYLITRPKREKSALKEPTPTKEELPTEDTSSNTNKNWLWAVGFIALIIIAATNHGGNSSSSNTEDLNSVALIACENRLKRGLHDPDSFKRAGGGILLEDGFHVQENGHKKYTVTVAKRFSATNGFGARVQNSYGCEVKIDVIADTWTLTQFVIN